MKPANFGRPPIHPVLRLSSRYRGRVRPPVAGAAALACAALTVAALLPGCAGLFASTRARPPGEDCVLANATFREANGGVGKEFVELVNQQSATATFYTQCPAGHSLPADLIPAWSQFYAANGSKPIHAEILSRWTEPHEGVLYRYQQYALYFKDCDFWFRLGIECAPPTTAPPPAEKTASEETPTNRRSASK